MKNQLETWEDGLSGRLKEHEFPFDPAAMAGFESLLAAETAVAGQPSGTGAPAPPPAAGSWLTGKVLGLLAGTLVLGGLLYFGLTGEEPITNDVTPVTEVPVTAPAVSEVPLMEVPPVAQPATVAPSPAAQSYTASRSSTGLSSAPAPQPIDVIIAPAAPEPRPFTARAAPRPRPTSGYLAPARTRENVTVAPLPLVDAAAILLVITRPLPTVEIVPAKTGKAARDRDALFPDVIDNRP